jgi:very-short-patch-repair endonuclease
MRLPYNKALKYFARELRKNMTDAERRVWMRIRTKQLKGFQFYRQKNIGNYIVDFYCPAAKLIIEIDGGQHYSEDGFRKDKDRDSCLTSLGLTVLRFTDRQVFETIDGVLETICEHLRSKIPLYPPL